MESTLLRNESSQDSLALCKSNRGAMFHHPLFSYSCESDTVMELSETGLCCDPYDNDFFGFFVMIHIDTFCNLHHYGLLRLIFSFIFMRKTCKGN